jgi:hypothetical protein
MSKERKIDDKDLAEITGAGGVMDIPDAHVTDSTPVQDSGFGGAQRDSGDSGGSGPSDPEPAGAGGSGNQTPGMD